MIERTLMKVAEVASRRLGRRPSPQTIVRWCKTGVCGGLRLKALKASGAWFTTVEDFDEFLSRQTAVALSTPSKSPEERTPDTTRRLQEAGLLT